MKAGDITFNQYGGVVNFKPASGKLKTEYRYRSVPISTAVPDLQLWLSMHLDKENPNAPLWVSRRGGSIGYARLRMIFLRAVKRAGIDKHYTLYKLRHARLTQLADILNVEELKKFAGHSRYSNVTPRYIHVNEKAMKQKVYRERGVNIREAEKVEPTLKVKVCPRCKHRNSPTSKFCSMCSMPLDTKTMFDAQRKSELLAEGMYHPVSENKEYEKMMKSFFELQRKNPELFKRLTQQFWENVAVELLKETQTVKVKA